MSAEAGMEERDYMLPYPAKGHGGCLAVAFRFSQALFNDLRTEFEDADVELIETGKSHVEDVGRGDWRLRRGQKTDGQVVPICGQGV